MKCVADHGRKKCFKLKWEKFKTGKDPCIVLLNTNFVLGYKV